MTLRAKTAAALLVVSSMAPAGACLLPDTEALVGSTLRDAAVPRDGSAGDAGSDASTRFCERVDADVCEDMDNDAALTGWSVPPAATFTTTTAVSPPRSLEIAVNDPGSCVSVQARRPLGGGATGVHIEADVQALAIGAGVNHFYLSAVFEVPGGQCYLLLGYDDSAKSDQLYLQYIDGNGPTTTAFVLAPWDQEQSKRWRHVVLDFDSSSTGGLTWGVEGSKKLGGEPLNDTKCSGGTLREVAIGLHCAVSPNARFAYDNVVVRRR